MLRSLAPAGAPIDIYSLFKAISGGFFGNREAAYPEEILRQATGCRHVFFLNSGRSALMLTLRALGKITDAEKNEVILPTYTCYTVPAAVARSGLKVRLTDIDPTTLDYNYDKLNQQDFSKVLAIVGCNLLGIPSDWTALTTLARDKNVFLIDDAAQAMGLKHDQRWLGTMGDAGFYSLGRGKNLTTYSGGILVTDKDEIAEAVAREYSELDQDGVAAETAVAIKVLLLGIFLRPRLYWLPSSLPMLKLGQTIYDDAFELSPLTKIQGRLLKAVWDKLEAYNAHRRKISQRLAATLTGSDTYRVPGLLESGLPSYLRFPILAPDSNTKDRVVERLRRDGIIAGPLYPKPLSRIDERERFLAQDYDDDEGALEVSSKMLTLPTHAYVTERDVDRMLDVLGEEAGADHK